MRVAGGTLRSIVALASGSVALMIPFEPAAAATTRTFTAVTNNYWSDPANWTPTGVPQPGDDVVLVDSPNVDLVGVIIGDLSAAGPSRSLAGQPITVNGDVT